jgi:hypothetical protein
MAITVTVTPGKQFGSSETVTNDKLNLLGQPTFVITGTVATSDLAAGAVTSAKTTIDSYSFATAARTTAGSFDIYTLTYLSAAAPTSLTNGLEVWFLVDGDNNQANGVKVNVGTGGNIILYKDISRALSLGDLIAGQIVGIRYNTAIPAPVGGPGFELITKPLLPDSWKATTAGTAPNFTATLTPPNGANGIALSTLEGRPIILKMHADGAGSDNLALTVGSAAALTSKSIRRNFNQPTSPLDLRQNQEVIVVYDSTSDTFQMQSQIGNVPFSGGPVASGRNIILANDVSVPDSKVVVTADEVLLKPVTAGQPYFLATSVNLTLDMAGTVSSPLGLDTGVEAASQWYNIYLIYNGTSVSAVFSVNNSTPTLGGALSAYKWIALVGVVRNNAASNFVRFWQTDRHVYMDETNVFTAKAAAVGGTYEALGGADLTAFRAIVAPIAKRAQGTIGGTATESSMTIAACLDSGAVDTATGIGAVNAVGNTIGATHNSFAAGSFFDVPVRGGTANYNVQWKARGVAAINRLNISGFTI